MTIKIYGFGWVGRAMKTLFPDAVIQDPSHGYLAPEKCDVAFICVPSPLKDGKLDTSIVESVIENCEEDLIIVRSTVMPGTCDKFGDKNIVFQPEFLGETPNHPMSDQKSRQWLILGGTPKNRRRAIEVYQKTYNANVTVRQVTNYEAEVIKLTENRAIAFKVSECQELYDICEKAGLDYYIIRDAVYGDDPRFELWWTWIYTEARGFNNSKCLRKDVPAFCAWADSFGANSDITKLLVKKSNEYEKNQINKR
jgi:UDP-glucose 6-dehydrogenase